MARPLVLQLQQDAMDDSVAVSGLLRKALAVARKLDIADLEAWIQHELGGYPAGTEIPDYRTLRGSIKFEHPMYGLRPVIFASSAEEERLSTRPTKQSVPEIESLLSGDRDGTLVMPFPAEIARRLTEGFPGSAPVYAVHDRSGLVGILSKVRQTILEWALGLEREGVLGEELQFSDDEKKKAADAPTVVNNYFHGNVTAASIGQAGSASQVNVSIQQSELGALAKDLLSVIGKLDLTPDQEAELRAEAQTIEVQAGSPKPNVGVVRETLRRISEMAAGGALGQALASSAPEVVQRVAELLARLG